MNLKKYFSDAGWGVEWPLRFEKSSIVPVVAGLAVAVTIELAQRNAYFRGVADVDEMMENGHI